MKHIEFLIWMLLFYPLDDFASWICYKTSGRIWNSEGELFASGMRMVLYLVVGYLLY